MPPDPEKSLDDIHHEDINVHDPDEGLSPEERAAIDKKLVRKLDLQLIPWVSQTRHSASRSSTDSLPVAAQLPLSHIILGSHKHW